jgi:hypothetical protein
MVDMFDAVPLRLIPHLELPEPFRTRNAEGEGNTQGKKSVKEAHLANCANLRYA